MSSAFYYRTASNWRTYLRFGRLGVASQNVSTRIGVLNILKASPE